VVEARDTAKYPTMHRGDFWKKKKLSAVPRLRNPRQKK
jgi:hypothetical protein